jgi:excisionase family DNA binding protein
MMARQGERPSANRAMMRAAVPPSLSPHSPQDWPATLGTTQVAGLLGVNRRTVHAMIARGELDAVQVGKLWRIAAEEVWPLIPPPIRAQWPDGPWRAASAAAGF